tara:strand:+ start:341 stop:610 length:270 start_codon:yes stop_codon:yes gene_type:complete
MKNLVNILFNWLNINFKKEEETMPLAFAEIGKALLGLMLDKGQTALAEHITAQIDEHCSEDTKKLLDGGIKEDVSHAFGSLTEMLTKGK